MKIVALDGKTLNPGDNPWDEVSALGELEVYDATRSDQVVDRAAGADIVITNKVRFDAATIDALPRLRLITITATGYDAIDIDHASRREIAVSNIPAYSTASVAQHVFALLLGYLHQPLRHDQAVKAGQWQDAGAFSFWLNPLNELAGKTMGIVGLGRIGRATAEVAVALGMQVIGNSRTERDTPNWPGFRWVDRETLFRESDVISLHCPLTESNRGFVDAALLRQMRSTAILVNTARGGLINEAALADALHQKQLRAALLDVTSTEPIPADNPLLKAPHCLITPHIGWATIEARQRAMQITADNIRAFQSGQPANLLT